MFRRNKNRINTQTVVCSATNNRLVIHKFTKLALRSSSSWFVSMIYQLLVSFLLQAAGTSADYGDPAYKPKLFSVSTSIETSVLRTASFCYKHLHLSPLPPCSGRKRLREIQDGLLVTPSLAGLGRRSSQVHGAGGGRFLGYWLVTSLTSTSTLYVTTFTPVESHCTPRGARPCVPATETLGAWRYGIALL